MRRITLLLLFMWTVGGFAQIKSYTFSTKKVTYSEIEIPVAEGNALGNESTDGQFFLDANVPLGVPNSTTKGVGIPIGFTFVFNGVEYDRFGLSTEGWISLGQSALNSNAVDMATGSTVMPLSSTGDNGVANDLFVRIAALTTNLQAQSNADLRYTIKGASGNRTLVIQWRNYRRNAQTGESLNFQIRLNEKDNTIVFAYGDMKFNQTSTTCQVGLRAAPATASTDFLNRTSTTSWAESAPGIEAKDNMTLTSSVYPESGLTYLWTPTSCGLARNFVASNVTANSATVSWSAGVPAASSGWEYFYSKTSAVPTGTGKATTALTANLIGLEPNSLYNFYMRSNCGSEYTPWFLVGTFKTVCLDTDAVYESFDFVSTSAFPDCWEKALVGTGGSCTVANNVTPPVGMQSNYLTISTLKGAANYSYAILPSLTNLSSGSNRLRFNAIGGTASRSLEVGYFTNGMDTTTFQRIGDSWPLSSTSVTEIIVPSPTGLSAGITRLAIRIGGDALAATKVHVDNVIWEPNTTCQTITALASKKTTHNSAEISWTDAANTKWQYVYSDASIPFNPYSVAGTDVQGTSPIFTLGNLSTSTKYNVWVRSVCTANSAWVGPVKLTTTCAPAATMFENFDAATTLPACWTEMGTTGKVTVKTTTEPLPPSAKNALKIDAGTTAAPVSVVAVFKPLSTTTLGTYRLRFKARTDTADSKLQIGYLSDASNAGTFDLLQEETVHASTAAEGYQSFECKFGVAPKSAYLAFRASGAVFYIDDVIWEPLPAPNCPDVSDITAAKVTSGSATLRWTVGDSETQWQYVRGELTDLDPFALSPQDFTSVKLSSKTAEGSFQGLTSGTSYKVWVRAVCSESAFGTFVGPYIITTTCSPVAQFSENFDTNLNMPVCWTDVVGAANKVSVQQISTPTPPSGANVLNINYTVITGPQVIAMPAVTNAAAGTHRLTFKYRSSTAGVAIEVGYLKNLADASTFVSLTYPAYLTTTAYQDASIELGTEPATQILAFRISGDVSASAMIDNVVWNVIPACSSVSGVQVTSVTHSSVNFEWVKGTDESEWQYAIGTSDISNAGSLKAIDVSSLPTSVTASVISDGNLIAPNTSYRVWVRSKCAEGQFGSWIGPALFTTTCAPISTFSENFNASNTYPSCWKKVGLGGNVGFESVATEPTDGNKMSLNANASGNSIPVVSLPAVDISTFADHILKFRFTGNVVGAPLEVGYLINANDPSTFYSFGTYYCSSTTISDVVAIKLAASPPSNVIAFRNPGLTSSSGVKVYIDDVSWDLPPTATPACAAAVATPHASYGNYPTNISWPAVAGADGYYLNVGSAAGLSDLVKNKNLNAQLSTTFTGVYGKTYYYSIIPYNYVGPADCSQQSFETNPKGEYCVSVPAKVTSDDGIIDVILGSSHFAVPKTTFNSYVSEPVNVQRGETNMKITFNTFSYSYRTHVWIDFNDDYLFDNFTERVFVGESGTVSPNDLDASFTIPATAPFGPHRMRIVALNSLNEFDPDPCYNGSRAETLDFTVNVGPITNDEPSKAITLTAGAQFATNAIDATNANSTASNSVSNPACGNYAGADVWFKAIVPSTGSLTFEVNSVTEGLTDTAGALYAGTPDSLQLILCNESGSTAGDSHPKITVSGRTPGETLYFRVWGSQGDYNGAFKVSAYDSSLGTDIFETANFNYYPNPVKDYFHISFDREISDVTVTNLLGQTIIAKSINSTNGLIDMSGLSSGAYLVKVTSGNQSKTIKMIKK